MGNQDADAQLRSVAISDVILNVVGAAFPATERKNNVRTEIWMETMGSSF